MSCEELFCTGILSLSHVNSYDLNQDSVAVELQFIYSQYHCIKLTSKTTITHYW